MWEQQPDYAIVETIPTTFAVEQNILEQDKIVPVKLDYSIFMPTPFKTLYPLYPNDGDNIGILTIPTLKQKMPIIQGTDVGELNKGVGHFTQSVLPGEVDNCVLSAHRETYFRQLGKLNRGDQLIVQTSAGTFTYEVNNMRIVHKDDKTIIVPTEHAVLTLTTCYPFKFIGKAPERYIVTAVLVNIKH
jgi:sortase A